VIEPAKEIDVGKVRGYVELDVTKTTGHIESITVDSDQFGFEEGGDWRRDRDDGKLYAGFLFIAFCDGFDLHLSVNIHGNAITYRNLSVNENNLEKFEIKEVSIAENELDVIRLVPSGDEYIE
jgi:hypothetical protein